MESEEMESRRSPKLNQEKSNGIQLNVHCPVFESSDLKRLTYLAQRSLNGSQPINVSKYLEKMNLNSS